jgi:TfoX/Sxy family transcriptional regulator of competence genes
MTPKNITGKAFPRPDAASKTFFQSIVPAALGVQVRPMFGNLAAFVNGNMFLGVFGSQVFVRLNDADRAALLQEKGASIFEPMPGRVMKEYVVLPDAWRQESEKVRGWVTRSLAWAAGLEGKKVRKKP